MFASWGAFNSVSVVVWVTFARGGIEFFGHFFQYIQFFMIEICWYIGEIEQLKVSRKKSIGNYLFSVILSNLAPFVAFFTVFYLFSSPDTLLSSYYCQLFCMDNVAIHVLSICHQDMWKKSIGTFFFIVITLFCYPFSVIRSSDFGVLGHLWSQNDVIMSWLRLTVISNCSPHPS